MKRLALYGILTGLALAGWNLLEYTLGYNGYPVGRFSWIASILLIFSGLLAGIRSYREKEKNGVISYWEAVLAGVVIAVFAGLIQAGFMYAYHVYINPGFMVFVQEKQLQELASHGATAAQQAKAARQIREVYQPLRLAANTFGGCTVVGLIFALIMATILKRYPRE